MTGLARTEPKHGGAVPFRVHYHPTGATEETSTLITAATPAAARTAFKTRFPDLHIRKIKIDRSMA